MLGERLYQLSLSELRSAPVLQRFAVGTRPSFQVQQTASPVQSLPFTVPPEKIALIAAIGAQATSGATQTCDRLNIQLNVDNSLTTIATVLEQMFPVPLLRQALWCYPTNLLLMPNESLTASGFFSATANANTINMHVHGWFLPKGNVQLR